VARLFGRTVPGLTLTAHVDTQHATDGVRSQQSLPSRMAGRTRLVYIRFPPGGA